MGSIVTKDTKNISFWPLILSLFIVLSIATLIDYPLSQAVVNRQSMIGIIGANYGQIVAYVALLTGGMLLISHKGVHLFVGSIAIIAAVIMNISDGYTYGVAHYQLIFALFGVGLNIGLSLILVRWIKYHHLDTRQTAYFLISAVLVQVIVITLLKEIMTRPRMIALLNYPQLSFQPWYVCNLDDKQAWLTIVNSSDYLKSFPSGHSGAATMSFAIATVFAMGDKSKQRFYYASALVYTAMIMLTRIRVGAHFLSDTSVGALIGIVSVMIMYHVCLAKRRKE